MQARREIPKKVTGPSFLLGSRLALYSINRLAESNEVAVRGQDQ
jgi:hypothetical protein